MAFRHSHDRLSRTYHDLLLVPHKLDSADAQLALRLAASMHTLNVSIIRTSTASQKKTGNFHIVTIPFVAAEALEHCAREPFPWR